MKVYFVRHGESVGNALNTHQHPFTELSETGVKQAVLVARRFSGVPVDILVSSPFMRARQTAEAISEKIAKPIIYLESLKELERPSVILGKSYKDPKAQLVRAELINNTSNINFKHSDEETFEEFRDRGRKALDYIMSSGKENILAVAHGGSITMILATMFSGGESVLPDYFWKLHTFTVLNNTGVTICDYKENIGWRLISWNDFTHLI